MSTTRRIALDKDQWGKPDRNQAGEPLCRWCRQVITTPRRRTFCGDACVHEWRLRSSPPYVREQVWKRDEGRCRRCGFDVKAAERAWKRERPAKGDRAARRAWRARRPRWEADHILPVADGGGECGLENYRLLCRACHVAVTAQWRRLKVVVRAAVTFSEAKVSGRNGASGGARANGAGLGEPAERSGGAAAAGERQD